MQYPDQSNLILLSQFRGYGTLLQQIKIIALNEN